MKFDCFFFLMIKKERKAYLTKTMVSNYGNDLKSSFGTMGLPKRLVDSSPIAAYVVTKESPTDFEHPGQRVSQSSWLAK